MCAHVYVTCVHAAADGCTHTGNVSIMTGVPVELCGQFWSAQAQSAALQQSITREGANMHHKISVVGLMRLPYGHVPLQVAV